VCARASFTPAVVASDPFLANFTISPAGSSSSSASAHSTSSGEGRTKFTPFSISRYDASTTAGKACPSVTARNPIPYSMYSLPSTSQTWHPSPRAMKPGASSGYWSSPLA
jgi:hypothetical protein